MIALVAPIEDYEAMFVFFGTPVVLLIALIAMIAWGAKYPRVRSFLVWTFWVVMIFSGFLGSHLFLVSVLFLLWSSGRRRWPIRRLSRMPRVERPKSDWYSSDKFFS